jgi:hypothetical protein
MSFCLFLQFFILIAFSGGSEMRMQKKSWSACKIFTLPLKIAKIPKKFGIHLINTKNKMILWKKSQIVTLFKPGISQKKISEISGIPKSTVEYMVLNWNKMGDMSLLYGLRQK